MSFDRSFSRCEPRRIPSDAKKVDANAVIAKTDASIHRPFDGPFGKISEKNAGEATANPSSPSLRLLIGDSFFSKRTARTPSSGRSLAFLHPVFAPRSRIATKSATRNDPDILPSLSSPRITFPPRPIPSEKP